MLDDEKGGAGEATGEPTTDPNTAGPSLLVADRSPKTLKAASARSADWAERGPSPIKPAIESN